jgi:cell division protein DivIC
VVAVKALALKNRKIRLPNTRVAPQVIVIVLVLGLIGAMAIEPTRQLLAQRERIAGMETDLHRLQESNTQLEDHIRRLEDLDYLEHLAREQVGLVRPGETAIVVMPPSRKTQQEKLARAQARKPPPPPPPPPGFVEGFLEFISLG